METYKIIKQNYKHRIIVLFVTIIATVSICVVASLIVRAMPGSVMNAVIDNAQQTNISPNPSGFRIYKDNGNSFGGSIFYGSTGKSSGEGYKHLLKNEFSSNVRTLQLKAYYTTQAEADSSNFTLRHGTCEFSFKNGTATPDTDSNPNNNYGGELQLLDFSINGQPKIAGVAASNGNQTNACNTMNGTYGTTGGSSYDPSTNRWIVTLDFALEGNRFTDQSRGLNQVRFQVLASGGGILGFNANTSSTNFGVVEAFGNDDWSVASAIPFGLSCLDPEVAGNQRISIYDPDVPGFGYSYAYIVKRAEPTPSSPSPPWTRLTFGEYNHGLRDKTNWDSGSDRYRIEGGNKDTSYFTIGTMYRNFDYALVFDNPYNGSRSGNGNVLSMGLPSNTINSQINCGYDLVPNTTRSPENFVAGQTLTANGSVTNQKFGTSGDHTWQMFVAKFSSRPSGGVAQNTLNPSFDPCSSVIPTTNRNTCQRIGGDHTYPAESNILEAYGTSFAADPVGSYVCFITRVYNPTDAASDDGQWRYSTMECSKSIKKPRVQFLGSDVHVSGKADSSTFSVNGTNYGSWGEYGAFTTGVNNLLSSGNSLRNGNPNPASQWNNLTFANTPSYGGYTPVPKPTTADGFFSRLKADGGSFSNSASSGVYDVGNITMTRLDVPNKRTSIVIRSSGTIRISDQITVENTNLASANELSQVVIIANNIVIDPGVTQVDAWLVTRPGGYIDTCLGAPAELTSNVCNQQLTVNGPIYTSKIKLKRTAGGEQPSGYNSPAERFNLRPDAELWSYTYANKADYAQTDFIEELPPRY